MSDMMSKARPCAVTCFSLAAQPDPGLLPRVLELFAKRGLVPTRFFGQIDNSPEPRLELDIQAAGLTAEVAAHMARSMGQIVGVQQVLMAERADGTN
jgi:acetolactate synthase small subunit